MTITLGETEKRAHFESTGEEKKAVSCSYSASSAPREVQHPIWMSAESGASVFCSDTQLVMRNCGHLSSTPSLISTVPMLHCAAASAADREAGVWSSGSSRWWMSSLAVNARVKLDRVYCKQRWSWVKCDVISPEQQQQKKYSLIFTKVKLVKKNNNVLINCFNHQKNAFKSNWSTQIQVKLLIY